MNRLAMLFALLAGLLFAFPAQAQVNCNKSIVYDASTNGATVLVTGQAARTIYVCGFIIWAGGTATVTLEYGTGSTCATGETKITPAFALTTQTGVSDSSPSWRGAFAPAGNDLCIKTSAGVAVQAVVYYAQR